MLITVKQAMDYIDRQEVTLDKARTYVRRLEGALSNIKVKRGSGVLYGVGEYHVPNVLEIALGMAHLPTIVDKPDQLISSYDKIDRVIKEYARVAGRIHILEIDLLKRLRPDLIYSEGEQPGIWAIENYLEDVQQRLRRKLFRRRLPQVICLDDKNLYYDRLQSSLSDEEEKKAQLGRESIWVGRIVETMRADLPVMIAGSAHIGNDYGLRDALKSKGVELLPLVT